ncbi:phosphatidylserine decarboxylase family protein [bacterium]|nr:MAG: phosphatidylserine decarboxylase family protein [bacterium]
MFAKDGYSTIRNVSIIALVLIAVGVYLNHWSSFILYGLAIFLELFTLYFFRNPKRNIPDNDNILLSPADGKVIVLKKVDYNKYLEGPGTQISIFLSPLDVHVNRVPITGKVEYAAYFKGQYLVAWHEKASELNERSEFGVKHESGLKVFFNQITGYIARRITFHIKEGDSVKAGYLFGMMKFGSRMDIIVPESVNLLVKEGDVVVGGETILANL